MLHYDQLERFVFEQHHQRLQESAQVRLWDRVRAHGQPYGPARLASWLGLRMVQGGLWLQRSAGMQPAREPHAPHLL